MTIWSPKTLREAVATIGVFARSIAEHRIALLGGETAARLLSTDEPDLVELVNLVHILRIDDGRDAAWQLLQAISIIVVAGGWQAVTDDPEAASGWARAQKSWAAHLQARRS